MKLRSTDRPLCALFCALTLAAATARAEPARPLTTRLNPAATAAAPAFAAKSDWVVGESKSRGPLSLIVIGVGVLAGGSGVYFGLRNSSAKNDFKNAPTAVARADAQQRAASNAKIANVSWIACGVLVAAGLGMLFFTDI